MSRCLSFLTAGFFLLHLLTECCSHDLHRSAAALPLLAGAPSASSSLPTPCGHHHRSGRDGSSQGNCHGSHCVFVRAKSRLAAERNHEQSAPLTGAALVIARPTARPSPADTTAGNGGAARRHLVLQVLLI